MDRQSVTVYGSCNTYTLQGHAKDQRNLPALQ